MGQVLLGGSGLRLNEGSGLKLSITSVGARCSVFGLAHRDSTVGFLLLQRFNVGLVVGYSSCFISVLNFDLYVCCFDALMSQKSCMFMNLGRGLCTRKTGLRSPVFC